MSSPKLERVKRDNPKLAQVLDRLRAYISARIQLGETYITPKLAAADLGLKDGEAFVLLELLAQAGYLTRAYNVYCKKERRLLASVDSPEKLDEIPHCDFCDADHVPAELAVEIAFVPVSREYFAKVS